MVDYGHYLRTQTGCSKNVTHSYFSDEKGHNTKLCDVSPNHPDKNTANERIHIAKRGKSASPDNHSGKQNGPKRFSYTDTLSFVTQNMTMKTKKQKFKNRAENENALNLLNPRVD